MIPIQIVKAIEQLKKTRLFLMPPHQRDVDEIISFYETFIIEINKKGKKIYNLSKKEKGTIIASLIRVIKSFYLDPIKALLDHDYWCCNCKKCSQYKEICIEVQSACQKTTLSEELIYNRVTFFNSVHNYSRMSPLEIATRDILRMMFLEEFNEQNKAFIENRILTFKYS